MTSLQERLLLVRNTNIATMLPRFLIVVVIAAVVSKGAQGATRPISDDVLYSSRLTLEAAQVWL